MRRAPVAVARVFGCALAGSVSVGRLLLAQTPASSAAMPLADSVLIATVAHHLGVLRADSLQGRDTPSPALDRAAQYLAAQFAMLGLLPGDRLPGTDDDSVAIQRYPIPGQARLDYSGTRLSFGATLRHAGRAVLSENGWPVTRQTEVPFTKVARFVSDFAVSGRDRSLLLVAGRQTPVSVAQAARQGLMNMETFVLYLPPANEDTIRQQAVRAQLSAMNGVVFVLSPADSATFAAQRAAAQAQPMRWMDGYLYLGLASGGGVVELWPSVVRPLLATVGVDLDRVRADTTPVMRSLPLEVHLNAPPMRDTTREVTTAPNVRATLASADTALGDRFIAVLTPLDQRGSRGEGDNAAGLAALLTLAQVLEQTAPPLRRSVLFVAASGERHGAWGSRFFGQKHYWQRYQRRPTFVVTLDLAGGLRDDSLGVAGMADVKLTPPLAAVLEAHPELRLALADLGSVFDSAAGPAVFAEWGVPSLAIRTGSPAAGPTPSGAAADASEAERVARVVRLLAYLIGNVANRPMAPEWTIVGRERHLGRGP